MELKEAIKILEEFLLILGSEYCYIDNRDTTKEEQAMETVLKYIKEESISKTVVEEKIKQLKEQSGGNVFHIQQTINSNIRLLQGLLNKGE